MQTMQNSRDIKTNIFPILTVTAETKRMRLTFSILSGIADTNCFRLLVFYIDFFLFEFVFCTLKYFIYRIGLYILVKYGGDKDY